MSSSKRWIVVVAVMGLLLGLAPAQAATAADWSTLTRDQQMVTLGKYTFFDPMLSSSETQSCASCHGPSVGFTKPDSAITAAGAIAYGLMMVFGVV